MNIIHHKKPRLGTITMECDKIIDEKLTKYPAVDACFSKSHTTLVSGGMGSGKTTWVLQMMKSIWSKCYEDVFIVIPENSFASISEKDNVFAKYLPAENIYHTFDVDTMEEIYGKLEENSSEGYNSLLIIDDWGHLLKDKKMETILSKIFLKNRHLRTTSVVLVQNYYMLGKKLREIINNVVVFNTNKSQNKKMFDEQFDLTEEQFKAMMRLLPTTHDYVIANLKYKRIFHDWNELVFHDK